MNAEDIASGLDEMRDDIVAFTREILSIPAIAPESGGEGEMKKAGRILELVGDWGFDSIERYD